MHFMLRIAKNPFHSSLYMRYMPWTTVNLEHEDVIY